MAAPTPVSAELAESTLELLSQVSLGKPATEDPVEAIRDLDSQRGGLDATDAAIDSAVADLALLASEIHDKSLSRGLGHDLTAAHHAGRAAHSDDPSATRATVFYNQALHRVLTKMEILFGRVTGTFKAQGALAVYSLGWEQGPAQPWPVSKWAIWPAAPDEEALVAALESGGPTPGLEVTISPRPEILPETTPVERGVVIVEFTPEEHFIGGLLRLVDPPTD